MLEGVAAIERAAEAVGADRLLVGSHAPFYRADAAPLKIQESDLRPVGCEAIAEGNARSLLGRP